LLPFLLAAIGAASLPHLTARTLTAQSGREAGSLMAWGVLFAVLLLATGLVLAKLVASAAGIPVVADGNLLQLGAVFAVLPAVLGGLVLAGMLAALFALGQAALFSAASAISHDLWDEILDRRGPEGRRIIVARLILVSVAAAAALIVPIWPAEAPSLLAWALALAAAGSFVPLVLGLWWRRCNEVGALGGIVAGFGFTGLVFLLDQHVIPEAMISSGWSNVGAPIAALTGLAMSLVVTVGLSLVTPAPEPEVQKLTSAAGNKQSMPIRERPA
jgi:cation/acetate symporter